MHSTRRCVLFALAQGMRTGPWLLGAALLFGIGLWGYGAGDAGLLAGGVAMNDNTDHKPGEGRPLPRLAAASRFIVVHCLWTTMPVEENIIAVNVGLTNGVRTGHGMFAVDKKAATSAPASVAQVVEVADGVALCRLEQGAVQQLRKEMWGMGLFLVADPGGIEFVDIDTFHFCLPPGELGLTKEVADTFEATATPGTVLAAMADKAPQRRALGMRAVFRRRVEPDARIVKSLIEGLEDHGVLPSRFFPEVRTVAAHVLSSLAGEGYAANEWLLKFAGLSRDNVATLVLAGRWRNTRDCQAEGEDVRGLIWRLERDAERNFRQSGPALRGPLPTIP